MNGQSKREKIQVMIQCAVEQEIHAICFRNADLWKAMQGHLEYLKQRIAGNITNDPYRMKELADIMAWKGAPKQ